MKKRILTLALALVLLVALVIPATVALAQSSDDTDVTGSLGQTYSISVPGDIAELGPFVSATAYTSLALTVTATTNVAGTVDITVVDTTGNAGFLTNLALVELENPLQIISAQLGVYTNVTDSTVALITGAATPGAVTVPGCTVQQTIDALDLVKEAAAYSTTLTFTATFS